MFQLQHIPPEYQGDYSFKSHRDLTYKKVQVSVLNRALVLFGFFVVVAILGAFNLKIIAVLLIVISFIWVYILIFVMNIFSRLSQIDRYLLKKNPQARFFPDHHISSQELMESGLFQTTDLNIKGDSLIIDNRLKICHLSVQQLKLKLGLTHSLFDGIFMIKKLQRSDSGHLLIKQKDGIKDGKFPTFLKQLTTPKPIIEIKNAFTEDDVFNSKFNVFCNDPEILDSVLRKNRIQLIRSINEQLNALLPLVQKSKNNSPFQIQCSFQNDHFYMAISKLQMKPPLLFFRRRQHFNTLSKIMETISKI